MKSYGITEKDLHAKSAIALLNKAKKQKLNEQMRQVPLIDAASEKPEVL
jgi:hypothetical protein